MDLGKFKYEKKISSTVDIIVNFDFHVWFFRMVPISTKAEHFADC